MADYSLLTIAMLKRMKQLDILKQRGTRAAVSDWAIISGAFVSHDNYIKKVKDVKSKNESTKDMSYQSIAQIKEERSLEERTGKYFSQSNHDDRYVYIIGSDGREMSVTLSERGAGVRLVYEFTTTRKIPTNIGAGKLKEDIDGIKYVEHAYYPQMIAKNQEELEMLYKDKKMVVSGNLYTTDSNKGYSKDGEFKEQKHKEYIDERTGKRYVRTVANFCCEEQILSDGKKYKRGDIIWVEVSPIKWLVDEKSKKMITEKILIAGVQFSHNEYYYQEDFEKTDMNKFINKYFVKEILQLCNLPRKKEKNGKLQEKNDELQEENYELKIENDELNYKLNSEIKELQSKIKGLEEENNILRREVGILKEKYQKTIEAARELRSYIVKEIGKIPFLGKAKKEKITDKIREKGF